MTDTVVRLRIKDLHELSMESTSDAPLGLTIGGLIMDSLIETAIGYWLLAIGSLAPAAPPRRGDRRAGPEKQAVASTSDAPLG